MAHPLPSSGIPPTTGPVFNTLTEEAVSIVLTELNQFFAGYQAVVDFKSATNVGDPTTEIFQQKLFIADEAPEDDRFFPALIVKMGSFREYRLDLGNAWENLPNGGKRFGGSVMADINVIVCSTSTLDLDRLFDYLSLVFFIIKVPNLQRQGIRLVPNGLSGSPLPSIPYTGDRPILRRQVTQEVWLEWFFETTEDAPTVTNVVFHLSTPGSLAAHKPVVEKR